MTLFITGAAEQDIADAVDYMGNTLKNDKAALILNSELNIGLAPNLPHINSPTLKNSSEVH